MTTAAPSPTALPAGAAVPPPRPAAEQAPRHRQRPPSQYWDVFDACWRTAEGRRA